ncbi:hypothetical protein VSR01_34175 [Actinacidiphila sp. DG2A-62]|jgi:hypothetical protein|uniref:hypothetical protein n=1 Tax=Actinacidiphila sp. DG2A-62 TaxID=3108821 RepID=UPI002DB9299B|nr:hypothetical protein [Actinacidiphila sp. DG2A-62]MEC3998268.1 hypothetical protein [Actinacidiphila sp. DG2A-62]
MKDSDFVRRVIGVLTEAKQMQQLLEEDPDREDISGDNVRALLNETMPTIALPSDATPAEIGEALSLQLGPVIERLTGAFSLIFLQLAEVHDSGRTDVSSAEVLQELALRADSLWPGDPDDPEGPDGVL